MYTSQTDRTILEIYLEGALRIKKWMEAKDKPHTWTLNKLKERIKCLKKRMKQLADGEE